MYLNVKELDVVMLADGREATVLECYDSHTAFLAEISDEKGKAIDTIVIKLSDITKIIYSA